MATASRLLLRLRRAIGTVPRFADWVVTGREALWLLPLLLLLGWFGGWLSFQPADDFGALIRFAAIALFAPAIGEEILFRALIIPQREEAARPALAIALSVIAFVAWHPLQALIFGITAVPVFIDPWFLLAVAALGFALARIYRATGSLWTCVALHWLVVVGWKAFLGGPPAPFG